MKICSVLIALAMLLTACTSSNINDSSDPSSTLSISQPSLIVPPQILIVKGESVSIDIDYSGFMEPQITYASEIEDIATVDENGIITANGLGTTEIVVSVKEKNKDVILTKSIQVSVDMLATCIDIVPNNLTLSIGQQEKIKLETKPEAAINCIDLKFWISDENIISYDPEMRLIKGLKIGKAILNIVYDDGTPEGLMAQCNVIVK